MERRSGFEVTPFFGAEWWSGAGRTFWSGVGKGANSKINGAYPSLLISSAMHEERESIWPREPPFSRRIQNKQKKDTEAVEEKYVRNEFD